jgi:Ohr subfamily peroxiredoxin
MNNMAIQPLYRTSATATGGRDGAARLDDGSFEVLMGLPRELGGAGRGVNPEQLFATGFAACFLSAMKAVSAQNPALARVPADAQVQAGVGIGPRPEGGFGLEVALRVTLPGVETAAAEALVSAADAVCPYSHAVRGNIDLSVDVA